MVAHTAMVDTDNMMKTKFDAHRHAEHTPKGKKREMVGCMKVMKLLLVRGLLGVEYKE